MITEIKRSNKKRYQCDKCKQIFYQLSSFKQHVVSHRRLPARPGRPDRPDQLSCAECGKSFRSREKFDLHRLGHGDPDLECDRSVEQT